MDRSPLDAASCVRCRGAREEEARRRCGEARSARREVESLQKQGSVASWARFSGHRCWADPSKVAQKPETERVRSETEVVNL
jgi:hypothetical protein